MFTIYVIIGKNNYRYVGMTSNLNKRLKEHNLGKSRSTKLYKPFILKYKESVTTRLEARNREKFLKSGQGRKFLDSLQ